ncbi:MAG: PP2C family serine/threonine-protein phosphatase [Polyangiaceae bacterium]
MERKRCPSCGVPDADAGDGYCSFCGSLVDPVQRDAPPPDGVSVGKPVGARPLGDIVRELTLDDVIALLRALLGMAEKFEAAGLSWRPLPSDFLVDGARTLLLERASGVQKMDWPNAFDVSRVLHAFGEVVVPEPVAKAPPRLMRLLVPHLASSKMRKVALARAELEAVALLVALPPEDAPNAALLCDPGLKRAHNEDATAFAAGLIGDEPWTVLVVCDGVSSSVHAEQASAIAAKTACDALAHFARSGDIIHEPSGRAVELAIRAAHLAICTHPIERTSPTGQTNPPGTTIVLGLVFRRKLTVGWVGDSRAYWLTANGAELLTRDHSWVNEVVARGEMTETEALKEPQAHALTRCLGPLENDGTLDPVEPEVRVRLLAGAGHVVLCSDGLWNYFGDAGALATLLRSAGPVAPPPHLARHLVNHALARGGHDNVSVAVYAHHGS